MHPLSLCSLFLFALLSNSPAEAVPLSAGSRDGSGPAGGAILFVLEGVDQQALKTGPMPVLAHLAKEGSVTWSAETISPSEALPAMASLFTGLPVAKHGITWNSFEFSRGYPRPPTVFDYLDLSGGRDSAIFFMDESLYQLAKPTPYTDYQLCGPLTPECTPQRVVSYIKQYLAKAVSGHGFGHAILALPDLLVVHLPQGVRAGETRGWGSKEYRRELRSVDLAIGSVLNLYRAHGLLSETAIFVTSLSGTQPNEAAGVPWIASGAGIKPGHRIRGAVSILDTGASVMRTLGLHTHTEWDSRPVNEIFLDEPADRIAMRKEP